MGEKDFSYSLISKDSSESDPSPFYCAEEIPQSFSRSNKYIREDLYTKEDLIKTIQQLSKRLVTNVNIKELIKELTEEIEKRIQRIKNIENDLVEEYGETWYNNVDVDWPDPETSSYQMHELEERKEDAGHQSDIVEAIQLYCYALTTKGFTSAIPKYTKTDLPFQVYLYYKE